MKEISLSELSALAENSGLRLLGTTDLTPLSEAGKALSEWQRRGYAGEMDYMLRSADLLAEPANLLREARSVLVCAARYSSSPLLPLQRGFGRVARYAWGRDYHRVLKRRLKLLVEQVESRLGRSVLSRIGADSWPLLERALGARSGLGFCGKNTLLIRPGYGSLFFLGEVLWDVEVSGRLEDGGGSCGSCSRCRTNCPTGALIDDYRLDARRCISYLSIEKRGPLEPWERRALGEWIFGCDICQEVCPFNHTAFKRETGCLAEFEPGAGCGPQLELKRLLEMGSQAEFLRNFAGTPLMRAGREGLLRNALAVAVNTGIGELSGDILALCRRERSELLLATAIWALKELALLGPREREHFEQACRIVESLPGTEMRRIVGQVSG